MQDAFKGAACFVRGFSLLGQPRLRRYVAAPFLVSLVVFVTLIWLLAGQFGGLVEWFVAWVPDWLDWIQWILWVVFTLLAGLLVVFAYVLVAGLVGGPFYGPLAEATEIHLTGSGAPSTPLLTNVARLPATLFDEIKKVAYALLLAVPFLLLFLVPVLQLAAPVLWFLCCAWVTAFSYIDYPMSNHGKKLADIRRTLARRRLLALGFGSAAFVAMTVPILNLFAVPAAVCGGTILWVEELRDRS